MSAIISAEDAQCSVSQKDVGYSSMTNLRRYPFHKVKIDRSYVAALEEDPVAEVIIDCAMALGKSLELAVVIEGIETEKQRARMAVKAPDQLQGFLFGRPDREGGRLSGSHEASRGERGVSPKPAFTIR
ncbi:EAL domain-containing protein [Rhizobium sp. P32RR-XVIII]|uniref:EAL domain-containing protein n=1 Tax=Rhizobium sp. P32RR-XVIII TaxID=2726738 RepID=UPI0014572713|nr:EAL domain-containing protein [Rhizobium sp. P32RR-XVIII]NLS08197.1 EAL domain-containing protein [Rhizobium sp. P32RR-XVIII]